MTGFCVEKSNKADISAKFGDIQIFLSVKSISPMAILNYAAYGGIIFTLRNILGYQRILLKYLLNINGSIGFYFIVEPMLMHLDSKEWY